MKKAQIEVINTIPEKKSKPISTLIGIIFIFLTTGALASTLSGSISNNTELSESQVSNISRICNIIAYFISGIAAYIIVNKYNGEKAGPITKIKKIDPIFTALCVLAIRALQDIFMQATTLILSDRISIKENINDNTSLLFIIEAVVAAPIVEELVFRYAGIELLEKKIKPWIAILIISAFFAILHTYNIQGVISIFILSVVVSVVYYYTRNVIYAILIHVLYNASSLIDRTKFTLLGESITSIKNGFYTFSKYWLLIQLFIIVIGVIYTFFIFIPNNKKSKQKRNL